MSRPIVTGRKGTGKTALRLALLNAASDDPAVFATDLAFRDYPWNVHNAIFAGDVGGKSRYLETWLFLMLIELAKLVVGEDQAPPEDQELYAAVRSFIVENWGSVAFDHRDIFRMEEYKVTTTLSPSVMGFSAGSLDWTKVPRQRLGDSLNAMNKWLKEALERLLRPDAEYFLVFDELDLDFERSDEQYLDSMIGLILAAQNFHIWSRAHGGAAIAVVLLRDDIYGTLQFPDKNKITLGLVEPIMWDAGFEGSNSLKAVVDTRINALLDEPSGKSDPWYEIFDEDVMRGTQHKYQHMVQRTYLRPRDLIQFGNVCLDSARTRVEKTPEDTDRVTNEDVTAARTAYSNYLRAELADEIHAHHPEWENWLELLRRIGLLTFSRDRFEEQCKKSSELSQGADPGAILQRLYDFSIIGFGRRGGGGRGGTDEYWRYKDPEVTFDADAPFFKVHPGLKENLDLREERR